ncbi:MAG: helix-turn-helix domain-containing protein [Alphaproteobacteria bacterium]
MRKNERAALFRLRLAEAMAQKNTSRSALAGSAGIDRSTVSQLLSAAEPRLPNGHVLAEIADALGMSADWLVGLSNQSGTAATLLEQVVRRTDAPRHPADDNLMQWYREAIGYKIRYVPSNLPDVLKTESVLRHEYGTSAERTTQQAISDAEAKLDYMFQPDTDIEVALSRQMLESFAAGHDIWAGLSAADRRAQLDRMTELGERLYPALRVFLFDAMGHYSAPFQVFGPKRAVLYLGQGYLTFSSVSHIRIFSQHFDTLVRAATIQANEFASFVSDLKQMVR